MSMPMYYKDLRERLDELLELMEVPRIYFHQLTKLNKIISFEKKNHPNAIEAIEIIHKIAPMPLVRFPMNGDK